ncbi:serine/threonine-protein kinase [Mycolicibacter sp. MYC017]|uniref:non-specific serine/threonine protein kinase n=1 Tax=[Mycobacterium] vasticus TaxID=2875777 RepID=A0ABU5Z2A1_9MYCO|nr:serine/threonine-protein kinase [Mycolicibacter sp. MYC017]MEB3071530.1 serine/threonine-protein kinase [Mycolicibacter sp. MYC017]
MLTAGSTFAGYRIVRLLGSGGMGEVYLAEHPRLPRRDALKVLPAAVSADPAFRERFNREADLAATLWHPHIVGVHDRGEYQGQLWIAMDHVDGSDASRRLRRTRGGLPRGLVVEIVAAVGEALDYAHQRGLLHRDVKPANILLTDPDEDEARIILADFGIGLRVAEVSGLTSTNMVVGTLLYAAPEQLRGGPLDGRADQYALAATAYHLLTGKPPVRLNPAGLEPALARALAEDPAGRYDSCTEFATALRAGSLAMLPIAALAPRKSRRRLRKGVGLSAAAFLALYLIGSTDSNPSPSPVAAPMTSTTTVTTAITTAITTVAPPETTTVTAMAPTTVPPTTTAPPSGSPMLGLAATDIGPTIPAGAYAVPQAMPYGTYVADVGPSGLCTYSVLDSRDRVVESGSRVIALGAPTVEIDPRAAYGTFVSFGCTPWTRIKPLSPDW